MRDDETGSTPVISRRETVTALPGARRAEPPAPACLLLPTAGQTHHLPLELVRRDIAGDHPGIPLMLRVRVLTAGTGRPVAGAVLDIRHCDALGRTGEETRVRGAQMTDAQGYAEFRTVHPGWQAGQAVHIIAAVHVGGYLAGGRSVAHTGRLYFPEQLTAQVAQLPPYRAIRAPRTPCDDDPARTAGGMLHVVPRDRFELSSGLLATITVAVS